MFKAPKQGTNLLTHEVDACASTAGKEIKAITVIAAAKIIVAVEKLAISSCFSSFSLDVVGNLKEGGRVFLVFGRLLVAFGFTLVLVINLSHFSLYYIVIVNGYVSFSFT